MCHDLSLYAGYRHRLQTDFPSIETMGEDLLLPENGHFIAQAHARQPVILQNNNKLRLAAFEWGIIAPYMKTEADIKKYRNSMVNARSEKVLDKASFWNRIWKQRCLVPVSGIFEHQKVAGWKIKKPFFISYPSDPLFYLPGLYQYVPAPDTGEAIGTFAILTREANSLMRDIHNDGTNKFRMPLFLNLPQAKQWLEQSLTETDIRQLINFEMPASSLQAWPVFSIRGKKQRNDGKGVEAFYDWDASFQG